MNYALNLSAAAAARAETMAGPMCPPGDGTHAPYRTQLSKFLPAKKKKDDIHMRLCLNKLHRRLLNTRSAKANS